MNAHTPGPWKATDKVGNNIFHIDASTRGGVAFCDNEANAALIAAAPDLLEAMEALFKECAMVHKYGGEIYNQKEADAAIQAAKAAIAKAKGELS